MYTVVQSTQCETPSRERKYRDEGRDENVLVPEYDRRALDRGRREASQGWEKIFDVGGLVKGRQWVPD